MTEKNKEAVIELARAGLFLACALYMAHLNKDQFALALICGIVGISTPISKIPVPGKIPPAVLLLVGALALTGCHNLPTETPVSLKAKIATEVRIAGESAQACAAPARDALGAALQARETGWARQAARLLADLGTCALGVLEHELEAHGKDAAWVRRAGWLMDLYLRYKE